MKIEIFDPAMCCPTGVCGPSVDPKLTAFAADLNWLVRQEVTVDRYNLAQQPHAFVDNVLVAEELKINVECLPLVLVNNEIVARGSYPDRAALAALCGVEVDATGEDSSSCGCKPGSCC